jgi:hypothetical protein
MQEELTVKVSLLVISIVLCAVLVIPVFLTESETDVIAQASGVPERLVIEGLVENPLNISYAELKEFPLVSEVATLQCVGTGNGGTSVTYNWTGVPLFYLLSMAKVIPGDYREVVFNATDRFSSSILLQTAMEPTTILALWANGTDLEQVPYWFGRGYRIVLPCRWGYKWVKWVDRMTVVNYDYKGTYERLWYSDEAIRPNCVMPQTNPPFQNFSVTKVTEYMVQALSNSSIRFFGFNSYGRLAFNVSGLDETHGYFYVTFLKALMGTPYRVFVDHNPVAYSQTDVDGSIYLYFAYSHSTHVIEIDGNLTAAIGGCGGGGHYLLW